MSNVIRSGTQFYMVEMSRREWDDGSITGSVLRFECDPRGRDGTSAYPAGSFRIDGHTGKLTRGPGWLRKLTEAP